MITILKVFKSSQETINECICFHYNQSRYESFRKQQNQFKQHVYGTKMVSSLDRLVKEKIFRDRCKPLKILFLQRQVLLHLFLQDFVFLVFFRSRMAKQIILKKFHMNGSLAFSCCLITSSYRQLLFSDYLFLFIIFTLFSKLLQ